MNFPGAITMNWKAMDISWHYQAPEKIIQDKYDNIKKRANTHNDAINTTAASTNIFLIVC